MKLSKAFKRDKAQRQHGHREDGRSCKLIQHIINEKAAAARESN